MWWRSWHSAWSRLAWSGLQRRPDPVPTFVLEIAKLTPQNKSGLRDLGFMETPGARFSPDCIEQGDKPLLFLWGDSTAATLYPGLRKAEEKFPLRLARFATPGCAPILANRARPACDANNDIAFDFLKSSRPDIVPVAGDVG
jgi:hypothetical protein